MKTIAIIGAGSHTKSSINILRQYFNKDMLLIFDDNYNDKIEEYIHEIKVVGTTTNINNLTHNVFLSIGDNKRRQEYFYLFENILLKENIIHFSTYREKNIKMGIANQIFANVYINSYVEIGNNNIINTSSILEHNVKIGNHNHISIGTKICGSVTIGDNCFIGAGSTIIDKISVCNNVIIGAGSTIVKDILEPGTYVGTPVKKIK
ncbi:NeuD/PglB/VioB family sugar acetyltransferase [Halarcobacter sp.]|uniref:NeuD/PglB/VioB family sugar acetyltransferase n=1 Tax=Halarcobacter sp. TaxID=2321133 RepID=UPI0029F5BE40|nr:NeuD/PglB/VioB family sugar acetyltransferase [Halarcobacter sp.]